jgi:endoribonuclease LACTB2
MCFPGGPGISTILSQAATHSLSLPQNPQFHIPHWQAAESDQHAAFPNAGTNTYLISPPDSSARLLLDTGQGSNYPSWSAALRRTLASESARVGRKVRVTQCVLSHWHHDHVGGVNELRRVCAANDAADDEHEEETTQGAAVKIYKYPLFDDTSDPSSNEQKEKKGAEPRTRERESQLLRSANDDEDVGPIHELVDGQTLQVGSSPSVPDSETLKLQVLHTPGHTSDHVALLITSSPGDANEVGTLFTGDAVLGHGTAVFEDLAQYMDSLAKMKDAIGGSVAGRGDRRKGGNDDDDNDDDDDGGEKTGGKEVVRMALPGHGAVITDARAKIDEYISHRAMREREVLAVLAGDRDRDRDPNPAAHEKGDEKGDDEEEQFGQRPWTSMDIVKLVYADIPESLHVAAEAGVVQVLAKLEAEGRVERAGTETGTGTGTETETQSWKIRGKKRRKLGVNDDRQGRDKSTL